MKSYLFSCVVVFLGFLQSPAFAEPVNTIAVMDFKANNAASSDAVAISGFVRSAFVKSGKFNVVDKANMEKILSEQAFQQTGCTDQSCAVKLGKMLNVQKMVVGEYTVVGGIRFLTGSLVDVETGRIEQTGKVKGFDPGNIDEAADKLVAELIGSPGESAAGNGTPASEEKARIEGSQRKTAEALLPVDPRVARGTIGVGLNYPGLGLRALIGTRWMIEARGQYETEAQGAGGRLYLYVFPSGRVYPYIGGGAAWLKLLGDGFEATGYLGEGFAGLEYFIFKSLSLQADFGPAYVGLGKAGVSVSGIRYVVNFGLMYYF